ncbi:MAG: FAD-binding domain [Myxococcota bacterium]|nr:FAD-binding domain [Myxococcota bacterium]
MEILVVGAGVAGPTLAYWLARFGHRPTLLERAPALRTGGYVVDFWGAGLEVAERMSLVPELRRTAYDVKEVRLVGRDGQRVGGFSADVFGRLTDGRCLSLRRGDLASAIYRALDERTETIFGDEPVTIEDGPDDVRVTLARGGARSFDLVIGADGLHSKVRALTFGEEAQYEKYLGYEVAAVEVEGYRPRDDGVYVLHTERGQQIARFAMRGDRTLFLFVWSEPDARPIPQDLAGQRARLRERFGSSGWESARILDAADQSDDIYFDRVSQIRMDAWARGRVALIGDAAHCVSLLAGQGSALAMIGALVLAGELKEAGGDHRAAFARYDARLRPFIEGKQRAAERFASSFAPRTSLGLAIRNQLTRLFSIPLVAELAIGRGLRDALELPDYG